MRTHGLLPITASEKDREDHSPIGFSGWERHAACHGSVALATLCPKPLETREAREGNVAHAFASDWLIRGHCPAGVDPTMEKYLRRYVEAVHRALERATRHGYRDKALWLVEGRVAAPSIHADCRGTVDSLIWDGHECVLQVHDLKYGKKLVEARNNVQLMGYALCARETYPDIQPKRIDLYIHQPRVNTKALVHELDPMELDFFEEEVRGHVAAIEEQKRILAETKDPKQLDLHAGDHCNFCPAWSTCHERIAAARKEGVDLLMPIPADLPPDAAQVIAFAKKALPWAKNVLAKAKAHLLQRGRIPGVFLAKGKRVRVAKNPSTLAEDLQADVEFGGVGLSKSRIYEDPKPPKLKTIPQLVKEVENDEVALKALGELWAWQDGAPTLALDGEDKEPYGVRAEDYFKAIEEDEEDEEDEEF